MTVKTQPFEFRFRYLVHLVVIFIGFTAPWDRFLPFDKGLKTWLFLAAWPARYQWLSFSASTVTLLVLGTLCAIAAAWLRTWASAYIDPAIVQDTALHGDAIVAAGPYRFVRNPLYLGLFVHVLALALLMPPSGALFTVVVIALFELRLIVVEEAFLTGTLGEPYRAYCARVPRLLPAATPRVPPSSTRTTWATAFLSEIYFWGVAIAFVAMGWRYNSFLITQGVIVSLGLSLILRAVLPRRHTKDLAPAGTE